MSIVILQWYIDDRNALKAAIERICPQLLPHTTIEGDFDDKIRNIIKCKGAEKRKNQMKKVIIVTGTVLLTTSGKRVLKKLRAWNSYATIILLSGMNDLKKDKRINMFFEKKKSQPEIFDKIATLLKEKYEVWNFQKRK